MFVLVTQFVGSGCQSSITNAPPIIPADYYSCQAVEPKELVNSYYSRYFDKAQIQTLYNHHVFVLKNIKLNQKEITHLKIEGYIWVDMIKCAVVNTDYCAKFRPGDMVDVIGTNIGDSLECMGLIFTDCYIVPAGSLPIPTGGGEAVIIGY
jgi:hypothetical protein